MTIQSHSFDYDVAVVGGGSGGYAAARTAVSAGLKTVVIDGAEELGGLCILRGCMPTKALLYAAEVRHMVAHAETWGINAGKPGFDLAAIMRRKDSLIEDFASYRRKQLQDGQFKLVRSRASFTDPNTLKLDNGQTLTSQAFIISTGSIVSPPPLPQLTAAGYITSDDALHLKQLPKSLIVLGGGAVAVEFAQFFARLDVKVSLIQRSKQLLEETDEDNARALETAFRREGIELYTGTSLTNAWKDGPVKGVSFNHQGRERCVEAEEILFALGRSPNTASLELEKAGVKLEGNRIVTNSAMQTSAPHVYAAGDCTGPHEIVHIAIQQGEIAAHNIAHPEQSQEICYRLLISVVFTEPQVATVGLTEKEAAANDIPYITDQYPFDDHGKSMIMAARDGFVKLLADPQTGEILGASCVGPSGGELIHEIVAAMAKRMTVAELAAMPHYHPSLAEIWTYPAEDLAEKVAP